MTLLRNQKRILQTDAHQKAAGNRYRDRFPAASYSTIILSVNTPPS